MSAATAMPLLAEALFRASPAIRYVALYRDGDLRTAQRPGLPDASDAESDRYEELLVNPTLLGLATQRGNIDCGGLDYIVIRYGNFFQLIQPVSGGHLSVSVDASADPVAVRTQVQRTARHGSFVLSDRSDTA